MSLRDSLACQPAHAPGEGPDASSLPSSRNVRRASSDGRRSSNDPKVDRSPARGQRPIRALIFVALCVACLVGTAGYTVVARLHAEAAAQGALAEPAAAPDAIDRLSRAPHLVFLQTQGDTYRRVGLLSLGTSDPSRYLTALRCQRVHMAAGQGLCLGQTSRGGAFTFDASFQPKYQLPIMGVPSRARVSPDGRYGAMTVFVRGHSYAGTSFSTQTVLVEMATGTMLGAEPEDGGDGRPGLEKFAVYRDGMRFQAEDENFWGVTFASDGDRFYATLGSGGTTYLVEGSVAAKQFSILTENVECPSLSPDGTRLVYKKRVGGGGITPIVWQLHVLDLATLHSTPLAETRNVDDQVEWLDDQRILYALEDEGPPPTVRPDIWLLSLDGGSPERYQIGALSPAVIR